ncbi:lipid droplet-associated protein [Amycolatopsis roodepoortensis]|uniref:lipid droplet-associated protein n=1 Tax=Amycolatopsis roodepoortensis TaxID=700274 RepID=UPI00214C8200|nr:lipid droplet-associated protein [Amycolatopsis roodepoortensis]UUV29303.1 lipid droplet-associated protein [Amycolatopsis roodepoortensis]
MKPLPLPLRVAAGLAVTTAERVRELPKQLTGLPVTVVSQVLQFSMRVQQHVTELAIKGDDVLSGLRPVEDTPSWATFDEDLPPDLGERRYERDSCVIPLREDAEVPEPRAETNGRLHDLEALTEDPWAEEERALAEDHADGEFDSAAGNASAPVTSGPAGLDDYDTLTLPQLRARLRRFDLAQLEELLTYEKANADRASFVGMLARRIGNVKKADGDGDSAEGQ